MNSVTRILIIDDDVINNFICRETIKMISSEFNIKDFTKPIAALQYISESYRAGKENERTILLLDLNMNSMTGWEFLDEFNRYHEDIKNTFDIYILSSSADESDRVQAEAMAIVNGFIIKPLTVTILGSILK